MRWVRQGKVVMGKWRQLYLNNNKKMQKKKCQFLDLVTFTLRKKTARYFSSKMDLFGNDKELQFEACGLMVNHVLLQNNKGKEHYFMGVSGADVK